MTVAGGDAAGSHPAFSHPGATAARVARLDWSTTPLGPVPGWPHGLRGAVDVCLGSPIPMLIAWGAQLTVLYNDAALPIIGDKHPDAFGAPAQAARVEAWDTLGPMLASVLRTGAAECSQEVALRVERSELGDEGCFTLGMGPLHGDDGAVAGALVTLSETTDQVLATRRLRALSALVGSTGVAREDGPGPEAVCVEAARALALDPEDIPLAAP